MAKLPPNMAPRGLTPDQAAAYIGLTKREFDALVRQGVYPKPLPGGIYDRAAIDATLDRLSGLAKPSSVDWAQVARENSPYEGRREVRHAPDK